MLHPSGSNSLTPSMWSLWYNAVPSVLYVAEHRVYLHCTVLPVFVYDTKGFWDIVMIFVMCFVGTGIVCVYR